MSTFDKTDRPSVSDGRRFFQPMLQQSSEVLMPPGRDTSGSSRLDIVKVLLSFLAMDLAFKIFGFRRVHDWIVRHSSITSVTGSGGREPEEVIETTLAAVQRATRFYFRSRKDCLPRALTIFFLLRRAGVDAELCFGVKKFPFSGHAWVEHQGQVLDYVGEDVSHYNVIRRVS